MSITVTKVMVIMLINDNRDMIVLVVLMSIIKIRIMSVTMMMAIVC